MIEAQLSYLRELAEAATPGPYASHSFTFASVDEAASEFTQTIRNRPESTTMHVVWVPSVHGVYTAVTGNGPTSRANAAFFAAADPATILALLDVIDSLRAALGDDA